MLNNTTFADKVYACWLGKNIGGTLGGPLEGIMELLNVNNYTQSFVEAVENDDLDLQLVNLHCIEQYGGTVTTDRLSKEWLSHVHFQFDEYGHALTNMRKGLAAPLSGCHNNFFTDCMGSPIRSELWGIVCAGMPNLAAWYAYQDACVDHAGGEGVYGEIFFAVFESLAFETQDIAALIEKSLSYLPADCATTKAVRMLLANHAAGFSWQENREKLIEAFGGENFTYAPINIAFTLIGLLYGEGFTERLLISTNCGWDTDCTCATIASMMGILYGSAYIDEMWTKPLGEKIIVSKPVNGFAAPTTIGELTERSLKAHKLISAIYETAWNREQFVIDYEIQKEQHYLPEGSFQFFDYRCEALYGENGPTLAPGEDKVLCLNIKSGLTIASVLEIQADIAGCIVNGGGAVAFAPGETKEISITLKQEGPKQPLHKGLFKLTRMENGSPWTSYEIPVTLLATNDWLVNEAPVICRDSKLPLPAEKPVTAITWLHVQRNKALRLCAICRNPLSIKIDGEVVVACKEETPEIPAYHRADGRKCADLRLTAGLHKIEIAMEKGRDVYFYAVDQDFYCAAEIDTMLQIG